MGATGTVVVGGAKFVTWMHDQSTDYKIVITPTANTVYTVTGVDTIGCSSTKTISVGVFALPVIGIAPASQSICSGEKATFNGTGGASYNWPGNTSGASYSTTGIVTTTIMATGTDSNNCSNQASAVLVVSKCTGIASNDQHSVIVYPNPSSGLFTADFGFNGNKTITVLNNIGQVIITVTTDSETQKVDLTGYAKGIFYLNVKAEGHVQNFRLINE
jgi:hypothetical protein